MSTRHEYPTNTTPTRAPSATATIEATYTAFGCGDVPTLLLMIADGVRWETD